ncbi:MAG TPA: hypothetical protein VK053_00370 [Jiangellaceae bacterium]|nr:hypothetical protein [Jiangellaceae bacterium]
MRTTLDIDDAVLAAARSVARAQNVSLGRAVSLLALRGLRAPSTSAHVDTSYAPFPVLAGDPGHVVTDELVAHHRDDEA